MKLCYFYPFWNACVPIACVPLAFFRAAPPAPGMAALATAAAAAPAPPAEANPYTPTGVTDGTHFNTTYTVTRNLKNAIHGVVFAATHRPSGRAVCIKLIKPAAVVMVRTNRAAGRYVREDWVRELETMRAVRRAGGHDALIRLIDDFEERGCVFMVMELADGGELYEMIQRVGRWQPEVARRHFRLYLEGLRFLHETLGVAHLDMGLENTLHNSGNAWGVEGPVICDLGGAQPMRNPDGTPRRCQGPIGKKVYMSPQNFSGDRRLNPGAADIWSCGVVMFLMLSGHPPWEFAMATEPTGGYAARAHSVAAFREMVVAWGSAGRFTDACWDLVAVHMLEPDEAMRWTVSQCLAHPYFQDEEAAAGEPPEDVAALAMAAMAAAATPVTMGASAGDGEVKH